jgi:uncharacterized membrane protein
LQPAFFGLAAAFFAGLAAFLVAIGLIKQQRAE